MEPDVSPPRLVGEFEDPAGVRAAVRSLVGSGHRRLAVYGPYRISGLPELDPKRRAWIPRVAFAVAILGMVGGYFLQYYAHVISYPTDSGGRPYHTVPGFMQVTFEMLILSSALVTVGMYLILSGLPRLHHSAFDLPGFGKSTEGRFLVVISDDAHLDDAAETLRTAGATEVRRE